LPDPKNTEHISEHTEMLPASFDNTKRPSWDRVIRVADQIRLMGVGRTQFYELAKDPKFPQEIFLGKRARGRWLSELTDYIDSCKHNIPARFSQPSDKGKQSRVNSDTAGDGDRPTNSSSNMPAPKTSNESTHYEP
jgi:predicted DNA-binding transcriptional regulator AlpA